MAGSGTNLSKGQLFETLAKYTGTEAAQRELDKVYSRLGLTRDKALTQEEFGQVVLQVERSLGRDAGEAMARAVITDKIEIKPGDVSRFYESFLRMRRSLLARQRKAEKLNEKLSRLKELHESVTWSAPLGLFSTGMDLKVTTWNRGMESLSGIKGEDAAGLKAGGLMPEYAPYLEKALERKERVAEKRLTRQAPGGGKRIERLIVQPLMDKYGVCHGLSAMAEDITNQVILEERTRQSEKLASVGRLAAGMAHEVGNPLTSISALAQELSGPEGEDETFRKESLKLVSHHIERINTIIKSLVDYSRQKEFSMSPSPVKDIIAAAAPLARMRRNGGSVNLSVDIEEGLPDVVCDAGQIEQVLINLLFNAIDAAGPKGNIALRAAARGKGKVAISVEDDGPGMSQETLSRVFTPFFTTKPVGEGSGLGLYVCYNIMENHNSALNIASVPGGGVKAEFTLESEG